jgi:hypothetical protein
MGTIEHEGDTFVLEDVVDELPHGPGAYKPRAGLIEEVIFHQTAGGTQPGKQGPKNTATFHTAPPKWRTNTDGSFRLSKRGKKILESGGRGWPGIAYNVFVPFAPEMTGNGKAVLYRTQLDGTVCYHTGGSANQRGIGVCFQGLFSTRHYRIPGAKPGPSEMQQDVREELLSYLAGKYGIRPADCARGHFDYSKASCPGDEAEQWIRDARGEEATFIIGAPTVGAGDLPALDDWAERERALWLVGFMPELPDGKYDYKTRGAIERFQITAGLLVDGVWGRQTEKAMRLALSEISRSGARFADSSAAPVVWDGP